MAHHGEGVQRVLQPALGAVPDLAEEAVLAGLHEVEGDLEQGQGDEPEDALAAHHLAIHAVDAAFQTPDLERVHVVLGDVLLLVDELAGGHHLGVPGGGAPGRTG